jgi:hypothetical protein
MWFEIEESKFLEQSERLYNFLVDRFEEEIIGEYVYKTTASSSNGIKNIPSSKVIQA